MQLRLLKHSLIRLEIDDTIKQAVAAQTGNVEAYRKQQPFR